MPKLIDFEFHICTKMMYILINVSLPCPCLCPRFFKVTCHHVCVRVVSYPCLIYVSVLLRLMMYQCAVFV